MAIDSGCVAHTANPANIPGNVNVIKPEDPKKLGNFVGAGGHTIKRYGKATVELEADDGGVIGNTFQVAAVTRPLHSVSVVADANHEVLFTKGEATVVPEGSLSKYLMYIKAVAKYQRKGGLYVARMRARAPKAAKSTFGRPGQRR